MKSIPLFVRVAAPQDPAGSAVLIESTWQPAPDDEPDIARANVSARWKTCVDAVLCTVGVAGGCTLSLGAGLFGLGVYKIVRSQDHDPSWHMLLGSGLVAAYAGAACLGCVFTAVRTLRPDDDSMA